MTEVKKFQKINIDTGIREIEVNDNGDTIKLRTADAAFQNDLIELSAWASSQQEKYKELQKQLTENAGDLEAFLDTLKLINAIPEEAAQRVNHLFGEGACEKIFATETPDILQILDFIEQIVPIFGDALSERAKARGAELKGKYNRNRGNV